ncbi:MAG: long-chain fatty acid--CoA ligase, partial [Spongiibacteraceae bacterium]|nr:long-chain fatty acid--CoA ligase [Spongiibacteraceae bacterium]
VELLIMEAGVASNDFVSELVGLCPALATTSAGQLLAEEIPFLRRVVCVDDGVEVKGIQAWDQFQQEGKAISPLLVKAAALASSPLDTGLIFFSSGSTAQPKAIQQTHRAAAMQCWRFGHWYQADESVRTWSANGFFWSGNFVMAFGSTLTVGGCLVLQRFFEPDAALQLFLSEKVSLPIAWPHQEARLTECPAWHEADLSCFTHVDSEGILATHPMVSSQWRQPNGYGMTETFTFVAGSSGDQINDGSNGPVLSGNTVKIIDPATGDTLPLGQTGEIVVKGPTLTAGYLRSAPEEMLDKDGFIHTADAGYLNEAGNLCWKGRLGDMIKTGGANVSPSEVDAVVMQNPAVQSTFTVGVPHKTLGEIVVSCVIARDNTQLDEAQLRAFVRQSLASYKVPRRVFFLSEAELPMTGSNKIKRVDLCDLVIKRLALDTQ